MTRQPKLLGLDIGFGFTKCVAGEGTLILPSCLHRVLNERDAATLPREGSYRIELDEGHFIVGDDAAGTTPLNHFARRPERLINAFARVLGLTAAAVFSEHERPLQLVVGLPVSQARQWEAPLVDQLSGYHKIGVYRPDGGCVRQNIHIVKVHVVAQPLGTFASLIMDHGGNRRPSDYGEKKIALIDIGFRTTDIMVMNAARFCHRGSGTIDMGLADGFEAIARKLDYETGCLPDLDRLYRAVRMGFIRIEDQEYNLRRLREETFRRLAAALADRIDYQLRDDWDLECVLLTGGGAGELAEDLAPKLDGEIVLIEHEQDLRLSNAQGHLSLARHRWGASGLCGDGR